MWHIIAFGIWLIACCALAAAIGGRAERITAAMFAVAFTATAAVNWTPIHRLYAVVHCDVWLIDGLLLAGMYWLAIRSTRFWPMWIVAIHLLAALAHPLRVIDPKMMFEGYYAIINFAGWPMVGIVGIASIRHHARVRRFGSDPSFATS